MFGFGFADNDRRDKRRGFTQSQKNEIWARQKGKCALCHSSLDPRSTQYDHKKAHSANGKTKTGNGRALCANCHSKVTHDQRLEKIEGKKKPTTRRPAATKKSKMKSTPKRKTTVKKGAKTKRTKRRTKPDNPFSFF
jgi:5-methylcytosine-specific restriction endonuclease McrA